VPKKYDPSVDHDALFDFDQQSGSERGARRNKSVPSVARGKCPDCANHKPIGIVKQGEHLAWRLHTRCMPSGAMLVECTASGVRLCDAPAKPWAGVATPECACGGAA
jgi:hypothetical protein